MINTNLLFSSGVEDESEEVQVCCTSHDERLADIEAVQERSIGTSAV